MAAADLGGEGDFGFDLELATRFFGVAGADHQERRLAFLNGDQTRLFVGAGRAGQDGQALPSLVGLRGLGQRSEQLRLTELGHVLAGSSEGAWTVRRCNPFIVNAPLPSKQSRTSTRGPRLACQVSRS